MCRRIPLYFFGVNFERKIRQKSSRNSEVADRVSCGAFGTAVVTIIITIIIFTNHHHTIAPGSMSTLVSNIHPRNGVRGVVVGDHDVLFCCCTLGDFVGTLWGLWGHAFSPKD